ncbi:hypothetical protein ACE1MS_11675 [Lysinibacillus sp. fkY74-1]
MKKLLLAGILALGLFTGVATAQAAEPVTLDAVYFEDELFLTSTAPVIVTEVELAKHGVQLVYGYTYVITYKDATAQEILSIEMK